MNTNVTKVLAAALCALGLASTTTHAWDFSYSYQTVFDANADTYIVGQQNVRKYTEWQNSPVTYWAPSVNDVQATLTSKFTFSTPTSELFMRARLNAANWVTRGDYGFCSLWGSTDGSSWQLLADCPLPTGTGDALSREVVYNQDVPASLLGATQFWIQLRMQEHNALTTAYDPRATWADSQFSRADGSPVGGFELDATLVPEPGTAALVLGGMMTLLWAGARKKE